MGMSTGGRTGRGGRGRRHALNSEINVTPLVDVMLVLLLVFMITATIQASGVPIELPKTDAKALSVEQDPLTVVVDRDGLVYVQETPIDLNALTAKLEAIAENGYKERIYVRGDTDADYGDIMDVMAEINSAGFTNIGLVTDPLSSK